MGTTQDHEERSGQHNTPEQTNGTTHYAPNNKDEQQTQDVDTMRKGMTPERTQTEMEDVDM